jgi:hypothetical protein
VGTKKTSGDPAAYISGKNEEETDLFFRLLLLVVFSSVFTPALSRGVAVEPTSKSTDKATTSYVIKKL